MSAPAVTTFRNLTAFAAARQKWASDAADAAIDAERADGARVIGRDDDSGYRYHTALGERVWDEAFDAAAEKWDKCETELRRLMREFDAEKYCTPVEHAFNEIADYYDRDLVEVVCDALEVV